MLQIASSAQYIHVIQRCLGATILIVLFMLFALQDWKITYIPLALVSLGERMWIIWVKRYYFFITINLLLPFSPLLFYEKEEINMSHL